jgi:hypothetical protein
LNLLLHREKNKFAVTVGVEPTPTKSFLNCW